MEGIGGLFQRDCKVVGAGGGEHDLTVRFYGPIMNPDGDDYVAWADVICQFFNKRVYSIGSDAAQAFFALPEAVTSYLLGQRRYGYEVFWFEKGDLDFANFWTYSQ